ncbi:MAG: F510_1955 family glycosylhydrolase [Chloroflexota bacterium]
MVILKSFLALSTVLVALSLLAACGGGLSLATPTAEVAQAEQPPAGQAVIEMPHIHGLGFSPDGRQLVVPAHDGLRIYAEGEWLIPDVPAHDYMGYAPADDGFYSSGHPDPASGLVNPLGLVKSTDGGRSLAQLGFAGESDFHLMGVGYQSHAIYVLNATPNSQLPAGMHYSLDDGQTWQPSALEGVDTQPFRVTVHPTEANVVALATEAGLFLSADYGHTFSLVNQNGAVAAATFSPDGQKLYFGNNWLSVYDLASQQIQALAVPTLVAGDAISFLVVNPVRPQEVALATFSRAVYLSADGGQSWQPIAEGGQAR